MAISINLLPPELTQKKKDQAKKGVVIRLSVVFLILMIAITVGIFAIRTNMSLQSVSVTKKLEETKTQIAGMKETEGLLVTLRKRLDTMDSYSKTQSSQVQALNIITGMLPADISILSFSLDKKSNILLGAETSSTDALDVFFESLNDPDKTLGKIGPTKVDNLAVARGKIKFDLTIGFNGAQGAKK